MGNIIQIGIILRRLEFTENNNSGIVDSSNKISCLSCKNITDGSQGIFVLALLGLHQENCTPYSGCDMKLLRTVKSVYLRVGAKEKILHKYVFVALFHVSGKQALNLADCQFPDGGSGLCISPYDQDVLKLVTLCHFIQTAVHIGNTQRIIFLKFFQLLFRRKGSVAGADINGVI